MNTQRQNNRQTKRMSVESHLSQNSIQKIRAILFETIKQDNYFMLQKNELFNFSPKLSLDNVS
jgi:hypothetical protein